jgi:hypothetical protein
MVIEYEYLLYINVNVNDIKGANKIDIELNYILKSQTGERINKIKEFISLGSTWPKSGGNEKTAYT